MADQDEQTANTGVIVKYGPYGRQDGQTFNEIIDETDEIRTVDIRSGSIVDGIGFEIHNNDSHRLRKSFHGGNGGKSDKINLGEGERITQISGYEGEYSGMPNHGRIILQITVHTNFTPEGYGPYGTMEGCSDPKHFKANDPIIGSVVGFFGFSGMYLDSIGVNVKKAQTETVKYGPYGSRNDQNFNQIIEKTDVIKKVNIRSGSIVDAIGFEILNQHGDMRTSYYGGNGGKLDEIKLGDGERITQISGYEGQWYGRDLLLQIMIHTNFKPDGYGPYGNMKDGSTKENPFKANNPIVGSVTGFFGSSGNYLESIGINVEKIISS